MQLTFSVDTGLGFDTIAGQLRGLADKLDGKPGATAGKPVTAAAPTNGHANGAAAAEKPARTRATKEQMEARRAAEAAAAGTADDGLGDASADDGFGELEPAAPALTLEQVIAAGKDYAQANGREAAGKVLQRFGVKSVRDLKPGDFALALKGFGG